MTIPAESIGKTPLVAILALWIASNPGVLQGQTNYQNCLASASGLVNPLCNAGAVRIGNAVVAGLSMNCVAGEVVNLDVRLTLISSLELWDVAVWINQLGGSAKSAPGTQCFHEVLQPLADPPSSCNHFLGDPLSLSYWNSDADSCGDLYAKASDSCGNEVVVDCSSGIISPTGGCVATLKPLQLEVLCSDSNGDGIVDTGMCASWNNSSDAICSGVADAVPGSPSKCDCDEQVPIFGLKIDQLPFEDGFENP